MNELNIIDLVDGNAWESGAHGYIIKAGQGMLEYNWRDLAQYALMEGKPFGLYWLVDARYSPESHKAAIKAAFPDGRFGALGLWLDIEKPVMGMTDEQYHQLQYRGYKTVESIWRGVQAYAGKYPGLYFSPGSWDLIMNSTPITLQMEFATGCECWIAHYTTAAEPSMRGLWDHWVMWQWREGPDYNRVNQVWFDSVSRETGGSMAYGYSITPATADGSKIRAGHSTADTQIGVLKAGEMAFGNELYAPSQNEIWLHILNPIDGWVASMHNGSLFGKLTALETPPPPPPPEPVAVPHMRQILTVDDGTEWLFECDGVKL